ncbi:hypothetical protein BDN71DRAFT_1432047 [Pleurotus eryngii]|uniref:Uncharacterized protein n=1 Tax=Pleurotus eryngii TaxID=5323 RepID=A0A9P6DFS3_PLEER|nr:hypothetical protein BDN71DRAFT_1432047 [Pleurotus eryngii]
MDTFYDKEKAVKTLERLILERTAAASSLQMYNLDVESTQKFGLSISQEEGDVASRLTRRNEETGEMEEATFGLQGIISNVNLLPFESRRSRSDNLNRLTHARQSVVLTGLGSTVFEQIVENCRRMYSMFSRYIPNAKLLPSSKFLSNQPSARGVDQHLTITAGNRFFTPVKQSAGLELVDIDRELDP